MPKKYYDSKGNLFTLAEKIGRGGEGAVYFCQDNDELVAKIYHEPITVEKAGKLRWMAENQHDRLLKVAAWPVETLHDNPDGKIVGFLMPSIRAKEIHELYSLKSRRVHFPDANWHFLIHTATNVARAFYSLQKYDHVMGDVNHGNCVVLPDGTVKLIDCDSYAIKAEEMRYPCKVGVGTHLAPELQRADLSTAERLPKHDNFGLAVIIFQLLFLGRHPFSGNYLGEKDKTLEDCIREYRFAYGKDAEKRKVAQPPGTLSLDETSPEIAELFERAFDPETKRPSPKEWIEALVNLSEKLEQCTFYPGHLFYQDLISCPWCRIEGKTGLILFPFDIDGENGEKPFNIYTIENLITNIRKKETLPTLLPRPAHSFAKHPTPKFVEEALKEQKFQIILVGGYTVLISLMMFVWGIGSVCFTNFLLMALCIFILAMRDHSKRRELNKASDNVQIQIEKLGKNWSELVSKNQDEALFKIRKRIKDFKNLRQRNIKNLQLREENAPKLTKEKLRAEISAERELIQTEIETMFNSFNTDSESLKKKKEEFTAKSKRLFEAKSQIQANINSLGNFKAAGTALLLITIFLPIVSVVLSESFFFPINDPKYSEKTIYKTSSDDSGELILDEDGSIRIPDESITDDQIKAFSESEKKEIVAKLLVTANEFYTQNTFYMAEEKLIFALRFDSENTSTLILLGNIRYSQAKYKESFDYFQKALTIINETEKNRTLTSAEKNEKDYVKNYIGLNHLELKEFQKAIKAFQELEDSHSKHSYLGLAYTKIEDYGQAVKEYKKALTYKSDDISAIYQLGFVYYKLNNKKAFVQQYIKLINLDKPTADYLLKETYKTLPLRTGRRRS